MRSGTKVRHDGVKLNSVSAERAESGAKREEAKCACSIPPRTHQERRESGVHAIVDTRHYPRTATKFRFRNASEKTEVVLESTRQSLPIDVYGSC